MKALTIKLWGIVQSLLTLERYNLFLQGALLILSFLDGYTYLLLRRSAAVGLLSRRVEDWVFIGSATCELLLGGLLAWFGRKRRRRALSAWLLAAAVIAFLVLAVPQPPVASYPVELCTSEPLTPSYYPSSEASGSWPRVTLLVTSAVVCALARISIWAHGFTYLDDREPESGTYFYGILVSIRLSVGVNAKNWFEGLAFSDEWWKGQLSFAMLTLMFSVLFMLFPKAMDSLKNEYKDFQDEGFLTTMTNLVKNKVYVVQTIALSLITAAVWGLVFHEADFVRTRFLHEDAEGWSDGRTSRLTGDILRTFVIVYFVTIFRFRFSGRCPDGVKPVTAGRVGAVLAALAAVLYLVIALLKCDTGHIEGLGQTYQQPACSLHCGCESERYKFAPVCRLDTLTTYYSPCHAGCNDHEDLNGYRLFSNCSCVAEDVRVVQGACNVVSCQTYFYIYQILYVNAVALSAAATVMMGMAVVRAGAAAAGAGAGAAALGAALGVVGGVAHVAVHLGYMFISDTTCAYSSDTSCLLHTEHQPAAAAGTSAALALAAAAAAGLATTPSFRTITTRI